MTRTLPWLKTGLRTALKPALPEPSKRQKTVDPSSDSDSALPREIASPKKRTFPLAGTSCPLQATPNTLSNISQTAPPPTEESMRPGLTADDIYIMVEDEFHAVARTFTAHLHHAEYVRLKHAAKNRNSDTISTISHPVDSITAMRAETRKKKEAEAQEKKMKAAVASVTAPVRKRGEDESSEESEFEAEERGDEPWQGTQLQRLMTTSPRKTLTSLTGLQGVMSHTRAAAGYSKPELKNPGTASSPTPSKKPSEARKARNSAADVSTSEEDDDDDLDAPSRAPSRQAPATMSKAPTMPKPTTTAPPPRQIPKTKPPSPPPPPPRRSFLDMTPLPKKRPEPVTKLPEPETQRDADPPNRYSDPPKEKGPSRITPAEIMARRRRRDAMGKEAKKSGGIRGEEIPMFLV